MIVLTRKAEHRSRGSPGTVVIGDESFYTMEQEDLNNKPFKSCVPLGVYEMIPWKSPKFGDVFIIVNEDLNVYEYYDSENRPDNGRYKCLYFHRGNKSINFTGCGGAGDSYKPSMDIITNTRDTCKKVNNLIKEEGSLTLNIQYEWE